MSDFSDSDEEHYDSPQGSVRPLNGQEDPKKHARAQHNALERRRRDNIKDMYSSLKDTIPDMQNERASRAMILKRAIDAIEDTHKGNEMDVNEVSKMEEENKRLEQQLEELKRQKEMNGK
ncbi:hypothetical protein WR25_26350 [Diploscapter pachys]|uniref:BHLH domain-containing protein n=1 Tax=Diploscapter pachys TaxID=2018661 RepID=A0A2A2JJI6_9BILA|nr:hypothetical protein WR25_26350 [Diploscapter pachys]